MSQRMPSCWCSQARAAWRRETGALPAAAETTPRPGSRDHLCSRQGGGVQGGARHGGGVAGLVEGGGEQAGKVVIAAQYRLVAMGVALAGGSDQPGGAQLAQGMADAGW